MTRTTFTLERDLVERAREFGVNVSAAARRGVAEAVRAAMASHDRKAYERVPEIIDEGWEDAEAWGAP
jgi:post-segregation antitoxin (ccd killing protein)